MMESAQPPPGAAMPPAELRRFAAALAARAGQRALSAFRTPLAVEVKGDESPVTIADRETECLMREAIEARFPAHGIFGEEFGRTRPDAEFTWVLDPIDGTRSFITGWPIWGTLLALLRAGRPQVGIIEMPALAERWIGAAGEPTRFESARGAGVACATSRCRTLAQATFYTTSLLYFEAEDRARLETIAHAAATTRFGGDCYSYGLLAGGFIDLVIENRLEPYDYFAVIPVVEGAGGIVTDWEGRALTLTSDGRVIAAATPELHAQALALLRV